MSTNVDDYEGANVLILGGGNAVFFSTTKIGNEILFTRYSSLIAQEELIIFF